MPPFITACRSQALVLLNQSISAPISANNVVEVEEKGDGVLHINKIYRRGMVIHRTKATTSSLIVKVINYYLCNVLVRANCRYVTIILGV